MSTLARYFHTVRYLRPIQLAARARLAWRRPIVDTRPAPGLRPPRRTYVAPIAALPSLIAPDVFRFLNEERRCASAADWRPGGAAQLWAYHLHYFDDLNADAADSRHAWHLQLLERWVAENPPGPGDAWDPYPVSRRITNWVKWAARGNQLPPACVASLAVQARWLLRRLEYHLLGNHLLVNAKALVHAGLYFQGAEAQHWLARGLRILERQLREQVLPDGGHFELSPMYHAAVLEDLLDLLNLMRAHDQAPPAALPAAIQAMRDWLGVMTHADGGIAFFNDAAFDGAPERAALEAYARRLGLAETRDAQQPLVILPQSGYVCARLGSAQLLCDCAPVGPNYQPGHAHADTLSFELTLGGRRLLVNSGTSQYGTGAERTRQRGTAAHNTVVLDGQDSSEVWAAFRVARRARVRLRSARATATGVLIEASHDGYRRLAGHNEHCRRWLLQERALQIEDRISGAFDTAVLHLHLHPDVTDVRRTSVLEVTLTHPGCGPVRMQFEGAASLEVLPGTWHPRFGVALANVSIAARFAGPSLTTRIVWAPAP
jgi:uncharacterized heparinase superfamily protein